MGVWRAIDNGHTAEEEASAGEVGTEATITAATITAEVTTAEVGTEVTGEIAVVVVVVVEAQGLVVVFAMFYSAFAATSSVVPTVNMSPVSSTVVGVAMLDSRIRTADKTGMLCKGGN